MAIRKKVIMIVCVVLLALMGSCADDKEPDTQNATVETNMLQGSREVGENGSSGANETSYPVPTAAETPAPPEPMESPFIPDDENVSMPDPG